ncbi:MAG TPA: hypothetical protein VJO72_10040, partial [Candidatus Dormibacteraeota bacterium]|nr:hypothetical protein [Candidatus Dormibacteraeota bacterium]
ADTAGPLFATRARTPLSRDAVQHLVARHAATAARTCPSLQAKNVTPHTLRHSRVICTASDPVRDVGSAA